MSNSLFLKTKLCQFFAVGACSRGTACKFAHGQDNLSAPPDFTKTQLCPSVMLYGFCGAEACTFAHSRADLRPRIDGPSPGHAGRAAPAAVAPCGKGARPRRITEQAAQRRAGAPEAEPSGPVCARAPEAMCAKLRFGEGLLMMRQGSGQSTQWSSETTAGEPHLSASSDGQWSDFAEPESDGGGEVASGPPYWLEVRNTFLSVVGGEEPRALRRVKSAPVLTPSP